jgi:type I restriction enzyme S subunit
MRMSKNEKTILPQLRFRQFKDYQTWKIDKLGNLIVPVEERAGTKKYTLMSVTSGIGLVSQIEKFGREIAGSAYKNYYVIKKGDFAYNKSATKQFPEGYISMLSEYEEAALPNSIFTCFRITDNESCSKFFDQLFQSNYHGSWLRNFISVGARAHGSLNIDNKHLWNMPVAFPNLKEQEKIADCLSSIDDLITTEVKKNEALKTHKKGLMQKLFPADGETVPEWRFPEFRDSDDWEETTLEEVADYENGKAHENEISEKGKYIVVNSKFISTEGEVKKYTDSANLFAYEGDILMVLSDVPNGRAIAKCYYVEKDQTYTVNQRVCRLRPRTVNGLLLLHIVNRNSYFLNFDDGVKQTNLKKDDVLMCPFALPKNPKEQRKIADCLSALDTLITVQGKKIEVLKIHKKGLMQGLFPSIEEVNG